MTDETVQRTPPKGKRKGGTRFPRYSLKDALPWAKKLVSKTHLGPEPREVIFAGVLGSASSTGEIKISALKQYNLVEGPAKAYTATRLARAIDAAPDEETMPLLRQAALAPDVFEALFRTFHGDEVTLARLKQRAAELKVHPEETERCAKLYVESLEVAGLVKINGDSIRHLANHEATQSEEVKAEGQLETDSETGTEATIDASSDGDDENELAAGDSGNSLRPRAVFNVNVNLDSSLDTEKLEKQLKLLKSYGAI